MFGKNGPILPNIGRSERWGEPSPASRLPNIGKITRNLPNIGKMLASRGRHSLRPPETAGAGTWNIENH
jgi:hypothetical protein